MPSRSVVSRRPLSAHIHRGLQRPHSGLGLVELLFIAGATVAVSAAGYGLYVTSDRHQKLNLEQDHIGALTANTLSAYASDGTFSTLNQANALSSHVFPKDMVDAAGQPRSAWGGTVEVTGMALPDGSGGSVDRGFAITYSAVPAHACQPLVANAGPGFYEVTVQGTSVLNSQKQVNVNQVAALCDQPSGAVVQFVYAKDGDTGVANNDPLANCSIPPSQTQRVNCPAGQIDANPPYSAQGIVQQRDASCPDPYGAPNWTAWYTTANTCAPICTPPANETRTSTPCPPGQTGVITEQRSASCPAPTGPFTWGAWTQTANTCAPTCATRLGSGAFPVKTGSQATPCPGGQVSTSNQSGTQTAACANPGAAVDPVYGPWVWTGGSCSPTCATRLASPPWATQSSSRATPCPGGQLSTSNQTGTLSASCGNPNAAVDPVWGAWQWSGGSCAPACVVPGSQQQQVGCPAGQTGVITQQRDGYCPAPTGAGAYGGWYQVASSCAPAAPTCVKTSQVTVVSSQLCVGYTMSTNNAPQKCIDNFVQNQSYTGSNRPNSATNYALSAAYTVVYNGQTFNVTGSCTVQTLNSLSTCQFPVGGSIPGLPGIYARGFANTSGNPLGSVSLNSSLASTCN